MKQHWQQSGKDNEAGICLEGKNTEIFINREDTVSVPDVNEFKRHGCSTFHRILVAAGGAETAVAAKRNELKFSTVWASIHSATKRRVTTVDHFFDIFVSAE